MTVLGVRTIGFIGAGMIGSQVARLALASGYDVVLSNSRGPETLADLVSELGDRARAATAAEAAAAGDLVVVTVPLLAVVPVPEADVPTSNGLFGSRPLYSRARISTYRVAVLKVTVTVLVPAGAALMSLA